MKNYVSTENSLKRFLKRKVKITMGLVVAFMITGTVGFAEGEAIQITDETEKIYEDLTVKEAIFIPGSSKTKSGITIMGENSKGIFNGSTLDITVSNKDTTQTSGIIIINKGVGEFNTKNTFINVESVGSTLNWGFGLLVESNGKAKFSGENVTINNYQQKYTSQTLTAKQGTEIDFNNTGDVNVSSKSEYGVTAVDNQGGKITFNNTGDVNIYGEILPGDKTANTNVVGIQSETSGSATTVTDKVNNFNVTLKGAGVDNDGTTYSTGTKAITMTNGSQFNANSKTFNITMDIASNVEDASPEGHTSNLAYGLYTNNGSINIGENTLTDIDISQGIGKGYAVYSTGKAKVELLGDTDINVNGKDGAFGVSARNGGTVDVTGKNISIATTSTNGNAIAVEANNGTSAGGEVVKLGGENTENIVLKARGKEFATGIEIVNHDPEQEEKNAGSKVEVNSKNLTIDVHSTNQEAAGIWVQNSTSGEKNADKITNVTVNSENIMINVTSDTEGKALGLVNMSQGILEINGNLEVNADTVLDTRGKATTVINKDGKSIVKLNGDIVFDYDDKTSKTTIDADVTINLSNADSYFNGNIGTASDIEPIPDDKKDVLGMKLGLSNGAKWTTDANSFVNKLTLDDGIININGGEEQTVKVDKLIENGGTLNMAASIDETTGKARSGKFEINNTEKENTKLDVNFTGITADDISNDIEGNLENLAGNITGNGVQKTDTTVKVEEGLTNGAITGDLGTDGKIDASTITQNSSTSTMDGLQALTTNTYIAWKQEMNSLNKRMGELRDSSAEHGVWARVYAGKSEYNSGYENKYQTYQVGYDKKYAVDNGKVFFGYLVSYTQGDTDYSHNSYGSGENTSIGGGIYGTWLKNNGEYTDLIFKVSRLESDFDVTSKNGTVSKGEYDTFGVSLGAEYGRRFDVAEKFFIEPSISMNIGRVGAEEYSTNSGLNIKQGTIYTAEGKVGTALGYNFDKGNVYLRIAGVKEFKGELDTTINDKTITEDFGDNWFEFGVGANYRFTENMNVYADVERTGDSTVETKWQGNLGFRYEF